MCRYLPVCLIQPMSRYSWSTAKVGVKQQQNQSTNSINQEVSAYYIRLCIY